MAKHITASGLTEKIEAGLALKIWTEYYIMIVHEQASAFEMFFRKPHIDDVKRDEFIGIFCKKHLDFVNNYMVGEKALDRHKVAAIAIASFLELPIFKKEPKESKGPANKRAFPAQQIAVDVGLSFMLDQLNGEIEKRLPGSNRKIEKYFMPQPFSCYTSYADVMARALYKMQKEEQIRTFDIAHQLFLLEYITLLKERIDPRILEPQCP